MKSTFYHSHTNDKRSGWPILSGSDDEWTRCAISRICRRQPAPFIESNAAYARCCETHMLISCLREARATKFSFTECARHHSAEQRRRFSRRRPTACFDDGDTIATIINCRFRVDFTRRIPICADTEEQLARGDATRAALRLSKPADFSLIARRGREAHMGDLLALEYYTAENSALGDGHDEKEQCHAKTRGPAIITGNVSKRFTTISVRRGRRLIGGSGRRRRA